MLSISYGIEKPRRKNEADKESEDPRSCAALGVINQYRRESSIAVKDHGGRWQEEAKEQGLISIQRQRARTGKLNIL